MILSDKISESRLKLTVVTKSGKMGIPLTKPFSPCISHKEQNSSWSLFENVFNFSERNRLLPSIFWLPKCPGTSLAKFLLISSYGVNSRTTENLSYSKDESENKVSLDRSKDKSLPRYARSVACTAVKTILTYLRKLISAQSRMTHYLPFCITGTT